MSVSSHDPPWPGPKASDAAARGALIHVSRDRRLHTSGAAAYRVAVSYPDWLFIHILLFVFWLGADVGVFLSLVFVKDRRLGFEARATVIRLAFWIDVFPRIAFAMMIPVGVQLATALGVLPERAAILPVAWTLGLGWCALHGLIYLWRGRPTAVALRRANVAFEAVCGVTLVGIAVASLTGAGPIHSGWFAWKLLLFGAVFLVVVGIDTRFQPFTTLLAAGPNGLTPEREAAITRMTNQTLLWALLLYALILAIAWLGFFKPPLPV
jgi:hypothetical protein